MGLNKTDLQNKFEEFKTIFDPALANSLLRSTGRGGVYAARDYITANAVMASLKNYGAPISEIHSVADIKKYLPSAVLFRLASYSPCLAFRFDELKEKDQKKVFDDPNYIATDRKSVV